MSTYKNHKVVALAAAIALAMGSSAVMAAAPAANQLPGKGDVITIGSGTTGSVNADGDKLTVALGGNTVIDWGKGTDINKDGVGGFNVGSGAQVDFNGDYGVLNIDSSGNPSQIMGKLTAVGSVFVANENGIIVGKDASISSEGYEVGLIANNLGDNSGSFSGEISSIVYNGTGGDVTVEAGADIHGADGATVLVSGGGNVNVDLGSISDADNNYLSAGLPSANAILATSSDAAKLTVTGDGTVANFNSAGDASSSGDLEIWAGDVAGTFTNTGSLILDNAVFSGALVNEKTVTAGVVTLGGLTNDGEFHADSSLTVNGDLINNGTIGSDEYYGDLTVVDGSLVNKGMVTAEHVFVTGGDLTNDGTISSGYGTSLAVMDGSIVNNGKLLGFSDIFTQSDDDFTAGADYSITNAGTVQVSAGINANISRGTEDNGNDTTGSFTNTGVLQLTSPNLGIYAYDDIDLGGSVQVMNSADHLAAVSASNPLANFTLNGNGTVTVATPLFFNDGDSFLEGEKVKVMADLTGVVEGTSVWIRAGDKVADDYAIRIANGVTVSADIVSLEGQGTGGHPNVILQGTLAGPEVQLGYYDGPDNDWSVSDVFTGPNGGILATGDNPSVYFYFTGGVKTAPYLNDGNFRYNGLPITVADAVTSDGEPKSVYLQLDPTAYQTNGTSNGLSGVNLLVNGDVRLQGMETPEAVWEALDSGSSVAGLNSWENTHLVLQSTGSINVGPYDDFYWPGYVYLGNIATNDDGSAAPGTLGLGSIKLNGSFANVLPGSLDNGGGIHFITQFPLQGSGTVATNGGSWVNFASDTLTQGYATGALGDISFEGGVRGPGNVVNYGKLDASMFHTHAPVATK